MNRREFLLAVGATACSGRGRAEPLQVPVPSARPPATDPPLIAVHPSFTNTNLDANPLAIHGEVLVQEVDDELWLWDLSTMRRTDAFSFRHKAFTLLADGSLAAYGRREQARDCAVYRLANGVLSTYSTWLCATAPLLLRTGSTDNIYVADKKEILRFRFDGTTLEKDARIELPVVSIDNRGQIFSLDDGRIVAPGDGISILEPGKAAVRRPIPNVYERHLARATAERFWYTRASHKYNVVDTLVLAHLDAPLVNPQTRTFAPSRIVHMASHGAAIAVLLMSPGELRASRFADDTWQVAVVSEAGTERWRAEVPRQPRPYDLNYSAVALSDKRLVLGTPSGALLAWDAATGAPVEVTVPDGPGEK